MKSGPRVVFRYSHTHEKEIPHGSFRRRMELHRASPPCPQRIRTAQDARASRDPQRCLLHPKKRLPVWRMLPTTFPCGPPSSTTSGVGAWSRHLGAGQSGHPRTPQGTPEARSFKPSAGVVGSQSVKTTAVGGEDRGYDAAKKVKGTLSDISWWIPRVSCSRSRSQCQGVGPNGDQEATAASGRAVSRLSHLWVDAGYRGENKGAELG